MMIPRGAASLLLIMSGLIVWAICFVVLYGVLSLGCTYGFPAFRLAGVGGLTWLLAALWLAHLALLAWMLRRAVSRCRQAPANDAATRFAAYVTLLLTVAGFVGTLWVGFPILMLPPCM